jgi:hypothetical protein
MTSEERARAWTKTVDEGYVSDMAASLAAEFEAVRREANDQQRRALELAWEALNDLGSVIDPRSLGSSREAMRLSRLRLNHARWEVQRAIDPGCVEGTENPYFNRGVRVWLRSKIFLTAGKEVDKLV